jgi:hypothetical protein
MSDPAFRLQLERLRRAHARSRNILKWCFVVIGTFIVLYYVTGSFLVGVIPFAAAAFAIFHINRFSHKFLTCPHCQGKIDVDTHWVCGNDTCTKEHTTRDITFGHLFFEKCARCGTTPGAFTCPKCREDIQFTGDPYRKAKPAFVPGYEPRPPKAPPPPPSLDELPQKLDEDLH